MTTTTAAGIDLIDVSIRIPLPGTPRQWVYPARNITISFPSGAVTAIVGESGCGKSVLALAAIGLLPAGAQTSGSMYAGEVDVLAASEPELGRLRGRHIGLVPQSAATHLTPVRTIGSVMSESLRYHALPAAPKDVGALLRGVELPEDTAHRYPHEVSGGMAQRVLVALACALRPAVLVADEPTSALDQHSALLVQRSLRGQADRGAAVVLITHDLAAARSNADRVAVMYAGRILESGPAEVVLRDPAHDYTRALLAALPENGLNPPPGTPPSLVEPDPTVCAWHDRVGVDCRSAPLTAVGDNHLAACGSASGC